MHRSQKIGQALLRRLGQLPQWMIYSTLVVVLVAAWTMISYRPGSPPCEEVIAGERITTFTVLLHPSEKGQFIGKAVTINGIRVGDEDTDILISFFHNTGISTELYEFKDVGPGSRFTKFICVPESGSI